MRERFGWFYRPTEEDFKKLWTEATFVFDANVLLNLYRYPDDLRKVFFSVLGKISDRVWIPYQVGLEFHRNRYIRIKQENKKVNDIIEDIKRRGTDIVVDVERLTHNNINAGLKIDDLREQIESFKVAHESIISKIEPARDNLPLNDLDDPIGLRVSEIFSGKVGSAPASQTELNEMLEDADLRFERKIPPGFKDQNPKDESTYFDGNIQYKNKYGDLILWRQTLEFASSENVKNLILITDDSKSDWWDTDGHLTRGPLPALIQEMKTVGGVEYFWIYKSDQFLRYAEEYLEAHEVTEEAIEQAKDISEISASDARDEERRSSLQSGLVPVPSMGDSLGFLDQDSESPGWNRYLSYTPTDRWGVLEAEQAVEDWLNRKFPGSVYQNKGFPDFIVNDLGKAIGFDVKRVPTLSSYPIDRRLEESMLRAYIEINEGVLDECAFVLVLRDPEQRDINNRIFERLIMKMQRYQVSSIIIGVTGLFGFEQIHVIGKQY